MPYRAWLLAVALGLVVSGAVFWGVYKTGRLVGETEANYEAQSDRYAQHAEQQIRSVCLGLDGVAQAECIRGVVEATNEQERAQQDLTAQTKMALWALWMLIVTTAMAIITGIGVVFVWRTLVATQDMARETTRIGDAQTRAYIHAEKAYFFWGGERKHAPRVEIWIRNTGQTPARWYKIRIKEFIYPLESQIPDNFSIIDQVVFPSKFEGPWNAIPYKSDGNKATFYFIDASEREEISKSAQDPLGLVIPQFGFSVAGEIIYETIFGERYLSQFVFGRQSLPSYEIEQTQRRDVEGVTINSNIEKPIPLKRYSSDLKTYQKIDG